MDLVRRRLLRSPVFRRAGEEIVSRRLYSEERWLGRARQWLADEGYRPDPLAPPTRL